MTVISELIEDARFMFRYRREKMGSQKLLDAKAPKVGDVAPDFTLSDISGQETITLSDFRGKRPVALVFGSYT